MTVELSPTKQLRVIGRGVAKVAGADETPGKVEELPTPIGKCWCQIPIREGRSY